VLDAMRFLARFPQLADLAAADAERSWDCGRVGVLQRAL
jgi:hypothetical protein